MTATQPILLLRRYTLYEQEIIEFRSSATTHVARLNVLPESLVVEHDVPWAETPTFSCGERSYAIKYIESLFKIAATAGVAEAYEKGATAFMEGLYVNPYEEPMSIHKQMWMQGWLNAERSFSNNS